MPLTDKTNTKPSQKHNLLIISKVLSECSRVKWILYLVVEKTMFCSSWNTFHSFLLLKDFPFVFELFFQTAFRGHMSLFHFYCWTSAYFSDNTNSCCQYDMCDFSGNEGLRLPQKPTLAWVVLASCRLFKYAGERISWKHLGLRMQLRNMPGC